MPTPALSRLRTAASSPCRCPLPCWLPWHLITPERAPGSLAGACSLRGFAPFACVRWRRREPHGTAMFIPFTAPWSLRDQRIRLLTPGGFVPQITSLPPHRLCTCSFGSRFIMYWDLPLCCCTSPGLARSGADPRGGRLAEAHQCPALQDQLGCPRWLFHRRECRFWSAPAVINVAASQQQLINNA